MFTEIRELAVFRRTSLVLTAVFLVSGCATKGNVESITQSEVSPGPIPWEGKLYKADGRWSLQYVKSGNLAYGELTPENRDSAFYKRVTEHKPVADDGDRVIRAEDRFEKFPDALKGEYGWYPKNAELWKNLPQEHTIPVFAYPVSCLFLGACVYYIPYGLANAWEPTWPTFAGVMEEVKKDQAGSVEDYDRRLAQVVEDYHEIQQQASRLDAPAGPTKRRSEARRQVSQEGRKIASMVKDTLEFRAVDRTDGKLLQFTSLDLGDAVTVSVDYQGEIPEFKSVSDTPPDNVTEWVPAENLSEFETQAKQARKIIDDREGVYASIEKENRRRLDKFEKGLRAEDFEVSLQGNTGYPPYEASVQTPDLKLANGTFQPSGPVTVTVENIDPARHFERVGVVAAEATVRTRPSRGANAASKVSGKEIGYAVNERGNWTHIYDDNAHPIGWVSSSEVGSPEQAEKARVARTLRATRPDGSPTSEALRTLVKMEFADVNERIPDNSMGKLMGKYSLESFNVIACEKAQGMPGYRCDVEGTTHTTNPGVQAMQRMQNAFGGGGGRPGYIRFDEQIRVVKGRAGVWEIASSFSRR